MLRTEKEIKQFVKDILLKTMDKKINWVLPEVEILSNQLQVLELNKNNFFGSVKKK